MAKKNPDRINIDYFKNLTKLVDDTPEPPRDDIGKRIRRLRQERKISVKDLSMLTGYTPQELENIESGKENPSLGTIMDLSKALDSGFGDLISGSGNQLYSISRKDQRKKIFQSKSTNNGHNLYSYMSLAPEVKGRHMEALIVQLEKSPDVEVSIHDGEEFIFVLDGMVELTIGDEIYDLDPGDSAYYMSTTSHYITAKSDKATILAVLYE